MPRGFSYSASLLTAIILALIPAAIVPDLIVPIHDTLDLRSPVRKKNDAERFPKYIQRERTFFKWLTYPPSIAGEVIGRSRTEYARLVAPDGIVNEAWPSEPPNYFALQHLCRAIPLWFVSLIAVVEFTAFLSNRRRHTLNTRSGSRAPES